MRMRRSITASLAALLLGAGSASAFVATTDYQLTENATLFPEVLESVTPLAVSVLVNAATEPVVLDFRTQGQPGDAPVPVFLSLLNSTPTTWHALSLEAGSVLDGAFEASAGVLLSEPRLLGFGDSTQATAAGPGAWVFDRFGFPWAMDDPGTFQMFLTVPSDSLAFRFTPITPEPAGIMAVCVVGAALWGRGAWRITGHRARAGRRGRRSGSAGHPRPGA